MGLVHELFHFREIFFWRLSFYIWNLGVFSNLLIWAKFHSYSNHTIKNNTKSTIYLKLKFSMTKQNSFHYTYSPFSRSFHIVLPHIDDASKDLNIKLFFTQTHFVKPFKKSIKHFRILSSEALRKFYLDIIYQKRNR